MKKNWLAILLIAIMSVCVFASCAPADTGSGSTSTSTAPSTSTGDDDTSQVEEMTGSGNVMPTFAKEGILKQDEGEDIVLPVLNDANYAYVEENGVATFTYPKEGTKVWDVKVAYEGAFTIDDTTFNSVTVNFKSAPAGVDVSYDNGMFVMSIDEDVTVNKINGDKYRIVGSKTLTVSTQIKSTDTIIVEAGPTVVVNRASGAYALDVVNAEFQKDSNITVSTNGADTMAIRNGGTVLAFGNLSLKETSGIDVSLNDQAKTGIVGFGICHFKVKRNSSRVVLDGYFSGLNAYGGTQNQIIIYRSANCSWPSEQSLVWGNASKAQGADKDLPGDGGGFLLQVKNSYYRWGGYGGRVSEAVYANG